MSELLVNTIKKADGTGSLTVPAESGTVVTTASPSLGRRNLIINGAMQVAQRGTSSTSVGYVSLDRWRVNQSGGSTTFSQENFASGEEIEQSKNYARFAVSAGNDNCGVQHKIEDVTSIPSGGTIVISFWAKGTNPAGGVLTAGYNQNFGSGGSADVGGAIDTFSITSEWTKYELVFTNPSYSGKTIGAGSYWQLFLGQGTDTSTNAWTMDITNVQVEVGSVATPFEHRSYGEELALCQRYYVQWTGATGNNYIPIANGVATNTTISDSFAHIPVPMRANPSCSYSGSIYGYDGTSALTLSSVNGNYGGDTTIYLNLHYTGGSWTVGRSIITYTQNASTSKFYLDAEL